jgi:hypothetical protein
VIDANVVAAHAEGVAGLGDAELGNDAEVAGVELGDFDQLFSLHDADVGEALGFGAGVVLEEGLVADAAADDFEEGDAAGEGIDEGFVDVEGGGLGVGDGAEDGVVGLVELRGVRGDGWALAGGRDVEFEEVEEVVGGDVGEGAGVEDGEDAVFADGVVDGLDEVLGGDGAEGEELFEEGILIFGDELDEGFVSEAGFGFEVGGDGAAGAGAVAGGGIEEGFQGDEIDDAVEALGVEYGELDGDDVAAEAVMQGFDQRHSVGVGVGVAVRVVRVVDDEDAGDVEVGGVVPDGLGDGLDAGLGIDEQDGGFGGEQGGAGFVDEHVEAGRVDEVDADAFPLGEGYGVGHGDAAGELFFVVAGDGGAIGGGHQVGGHVGGLEQGGDQGCLAAVRVTGERDVADVGVGVALHPHLLKTGLTRRWCVVRGRSSAGGALPTATEGLSSTWSF